MLQKGWNRTQSILSEILRELDDSVCDRWELHQPYGINAIHPAETGNERVVRRNDRTDCVKTRCKLACRRHLSWLQLFSSLLL